MLNCDTVPLKAELSSEALWDKMAEPFSTTPHCWPSPSKGKGMSSVGRLLQLAALARSPQGCLQLTASPSGQEALLQDGGRMGECASPRPPQTTMKNLKQTCNNFSIGFRDCQMMAQRPNLAGCLFWKLLYWDTAWLFLFVLCLLPVAALALQHQSSCDRDRRAQGD